MSSNAPLASPVGPAKGPAVCFNRLRSSDPSASIKGLAWAKPWATPGAARLPAAAPFVAIGLRIAASVALIVAVVAGLVGGAPGLGQLLAMYQTGNQIAKTFAVVLLLGILGILVSRGIVFAQRRLVFWMGK